MISDGVTDIINRNRATIEQAKQEILQLRQNKAELVNALEELVDTCGEQIRRMDRWGESHNELSLMMDRSKSVLERMKDD